MRLSVDVPQFRYPNGATISLPTLSVAAGEIVVLTGRSGGGKSTLIHLAVGVLALAPNAGRIRLGDHALETLAPSLRDQLRPSIVGWIPQRNHLIHSLTVFENMCLPAINGRSRSNAESTAQAATRWLTALAVNEFASRKPSALSVGQASRVCTARALAARPTIICADEPSAALDQESTELIAAAFATYVDEGGALLVATHDSALISALQSRSSSVRTLSLERP